MERLPSLASIAPNRTRFVAAFLLVFYTTPVSALEIDLASFVPASSIAQGMLRRLGKATEKGETARATQLSREFRSKLFHARGALGRGFLSRPASLELFLKVEPDIGAQQLKHEPQIKVSIPAGRVEHAPAELQLSVKQNQDQDGSVMAVYNVEF